MDELISVIIPIYNVEEYLVQCLDSVIDQTYKNLEIILVDDGSPDNCGLICDLYAQKDKRIKVIHQDNQGLSSARNRGMDIMTGKYFAFTDSDDVLDLNFVENLYILITKYNTDISMCDFYRFNSEDSIPSQNISESTTIRVMTQEEYAFKLIGNYTMPYSVVWNKLYRTDILGSFRFQPGRKFEDSLFFADYLLLGVTCVSTSEKLYNYRNRLNSLTNSKDLDYIIESVNVSISQYNTLRNRYGSEYRQYFYIRLLNRTSRFAADIYWNLDKKSEKRLRYIWLQFYNSNRQHINKHKENIKILLYRYFPILYYILIKKSICSIFSTSKK